MSAFLHDEGIPGGTLDTKTLAGGPRLKGAPIVEFDIERAMYEAGLDADGTRYDGWYQWEELTSGPRVKRGYYLTAAIFEDTEPLDYLVTDAGPYPTAHEAAVVGQQLLRNWFDKFKKQSKGRLVGKSGAPTQLVDLGEAEPILLLCGASPSFLERTSLPLFVSRNRLADLKTVPRALGPWAMDSGGFTEIGKHGKWRSSAREYAEFVAWVMGDDGNKLMWAAPQDWMCEPQMLHKSGLTATEHQQRTVDNFVELRSIAPDLPIIPVLQAFWGGPFVDKETQWVWDSIDVHPHGPGARYDQHIEMYAKAGVDLREYPLVGIGSVCRRAESFAFYLDLQQQLAPLQQAGVRFHAFGFKATSLSATFTNDFLASVDSMAWSFGARFKEERLVPWHTHAKCNGCVESLLLWRARLLTQYPHLYAPLPDGGVYALPGADGEPVLTPRFKKLMDTFRKQTLSEDNLAALDDYPFESTAVRMPSEPSKLQAALERTPPGVYLPPLAMPRRTR